MKYYLICLLLVIGTLRAQNQQTPCPSANQGIVPQSTEVQALLDSIVNHGIPGIAISIRTKQGSWSGSAGYARLEDRTPMTSCHLQYLQSVSKTVMSVAILQLVSEKKIRLDAPLEDYLPKEQAKYLTTSRRVTIRMLLNHTSGLPEYNMRPLYVSRLLQHPDYRFQPVDYLKFIDGLPLDFEPGSKYSYRNTDHLVLALIADAITGDHAAWINEHVFKPLKLEHTFYRQDPDYLKYPELPDSYWDRHSDGMIENVTTLQRDNVAALIGDDGIVATPSDAVQFLQGLLEGRLLSPEMLSEMKVWAKDTKGNPRYGLGLAYRTIAGQEAWGHSGGGIGAGCELYYLPGKQVYYFVAINLGTVTDSPIHDRLAPWLDKLHEAIVR